MQVNIEYAYTENEIPAGCRKPRRVSHVKKSSVQITEVTSLEAPIAIRTHLKSADIWKTIPVLYRWAFGKLWTSVRTMHAQPNSFTSGKFDVNYEINEHLVAYRDATDPYNNSSSLYKTGLHLSSNPSQQQAEEAITQWAQDCLIIDGVFHRVAGEPRYVVMTFGLGNDHGGTSLISDDWFNANISHENYFSALQLNQATARGRKVAQARGDKNKVWLTPNPSIEVLIPEAIKVDPSRQHGEGHPLLQSLEVTITECAGNDMLTALTIVDNCH